MKHLVLAVIAALMPVPVSAQHVEAGEYLPLAEQGDARSQTRLGLMYTIGGDGLPQDYVEAARWLRLAAVQGDEIAQMTLGTLYRDGAGVPQDYVAAHVWLNISAAVGSGNMPEISASIRDRVAARMTAEHVAEAQRLARVCMDSGYQDCP